MTFGTSSTYEEQTKDLLRQAKNDLGNIDVRMKELEKEREHLQKEVQALEMSLATYLRRTGKEPAPPSDWTSILSGYKTHSERIVAIADHEGGEIGLSEVTDILFSTGLMESGTRESAYVGIYNRIKALAKKGVFRQVDRGRYRLANTQRAMPIVGA